MLGHHRNDPIQRGTGPQPFDLRNLAVGAAVAQRLPDAQRELKSDPGG
jgi:hypothetical protein